jgi:nucleotide-binding universal stress UspA family protein
VIVGVDGRDHDADALALAPTLHRALGGRLLIAHVIPQAPPGRGMVGFESLARRDGRDLLIRCALQIADGADTELIEPGDPAQELAKLAAERHAGVLVLAATHRGGIGRMVPGSVASHLLTRSPCAISIAPAGYARVTHPAAGPIGVVYEDASESDAALAAGGAAAVRLGVPVRLYHAVHEMSAGWEEYRAQLSGRAHRLLDDGLSKLPRGVDATAALIEGNVVETVAHAADSDHVGLLFVGTSGYGTAGEALAGGVVGGLLHAARCPLVICRADTRPPAPPREAHGVVTPRERAG